MPIPRRRRANPMPNPLGSAWKSDMFLNTITSGLADFKQEDPKVIDKLRSMLRKIADSDEIWNAIKESAEATQRFRIAAKEIKP